MPKFLNKVILCLFVLALIVSCKNDKKEVLSKQEKNNYLPNLDDLFSDFETIDSTKQFQAFASKIYNENRDLNSSELYVYSAMFYARAEMADSVIHALNKAIKFGMSNPKILSKYQWQELVETSSLYPDLERKLDSISTALKSVENFEIELASMSAFWPYMERAQNDTLNAETIFKDFIFAGPQEIRDYYVLRYDSPENMKYQMVSAAPMYYQYLKQQFSADNIKGMTSQIEDWMRGFKSIYPEAVFPKVYVVPGILNSGGTASEMGMFVGGDMYGKSHDMPTHGLTDWQKSAIMETSDMSPLIMHELMHFEQNYQDSRMNETVKGKIVQEGVCDFMVELLTGNELDNGGTRFLKNPDNFEMIADDFKITSDTNDFSKWMYNGGHIKDRPADIGYTLGYLISKSYYQNHDDKKQAVYDLLNTNNIDTIYLNSDYAKLIQ